jgi:hypothetical protein
VIVQCGRQITTEEIAQIRETVETFSSLSRTELAHTVCEHLGWHTASGGNKVDACMKLFKILEDRGMIQLPAKQDKPNTGNNKPGKKQAVKNKPPVQAPVEGRLSDIGPINLRVVRDKEETDLFNEYLLHYHYLGYSRPFGCFLRYFIEGSGTILGCLLFSGAAKALTPRDQWIGWSPNQRMRNQGFLVNNQRFLIFPWVKVRYLASHVLGKVVKALAKDWQQRWGYQPVLLETFVDPQYFAGTCYQAANFKYLGMTSGMGLRRQGKRYTTNPKKIFVYPLVDNFQQVLSSDSVIANDAQTN